MNICILIHSLTGTTLKFGKLLKIHLEEAGHNVQLIDLQTNIPIKNAHINKMPNFEIINLSSIEDYDFIIIGSPVWGFSPTPVAYRALQQLKDLKGKKFVSFVTMGFPFKNMGGTRAVSILNKIATEKGANVLSSIIIPKMFHKYDIQMEKEAAIFCDKYLS